MRRSRALCSAARRFEMGLKPAFPNRGKGLTSGFNLFKSVAFGMNGCFLSSEIACSKGMVSRRNAGRDFAPLCGMRSPAAPARLPSKRPPESPREAAAERRTARTGVTIETGASAAVWSRETKITAGVRGPAESATAAASTGEAPNGVTEAEAETVRGLAADNRNSAEPPVMRADAVPTGRIVCAADLEADGTKNSAEPIKYAATRIARVSVFIR